MSTDLVVRDNLGQQALVRLDTEQIKFLATTEFVDRKIRGNLPAIFATIATGREIGIGDMAALRGIDIIDGRPSFRGELMASLVRQEGHSITGTSDGLIATVRGRRRDSGDELEVTYTIEEAKNAGLLKKDAWQKYPADMLWWRAISRLCKRLFSDVFAGMGTYLPDEVDDIEEHTDSVGEPVEGTVAADRVAPAPVEGVSSAGRGVEPTSPTEDPAAGTPFAYDVDAPVEPAGAKSAEWWAGDLEKDEPMWKKLNVLVGQLRPDHLSTLQLWQSMGRDPEPSEDGVLHWSPLRDSLTRREAHELVDRLEKYAKDKLGATS